eukprot:3824982-Rhodomonas_salina.10
MSVPGGRVSYDGGTPVYSDAVAYDGAVYGTAIVYDGTAVAYGSAVCSMAEAYGGRVVPCPSVGARHC